MALFYKVYYKCPICNHIIILGPECQCRYKVKAGDYYCCQCGTITKRRLWRHSFDNLAKLSDNIPDRVFLLNEWTRISLPEVNNDTT